MVSTNLLRWQNDTDDELTAYCGNVDTNDEIGPGKWDDANDKLEINCDSTDFQAKWDDSANTLESRNVADACCEGECDTPCDECPDNCGPPCFWVEHTDGVGYFEGIVYWDYFGCCWRGSVTYAEDFWAGWLDETFGFAYCSDFSTWVVLPPVFAGACCVEEIAGWTIDDSKFTCGGGGLITSNIVTPVTIDVITPCPDCGDCPP